MSRKMKSMTPEQQTAFDVAVSTTASKVTYGGAGASVISWFMSSEFGMLMGILIGVIGLGVNWYYKHKEDCRRQEEHNRRMGMWE